MDDQALRIPDIRKQREERDAVNQLTACCCGLFIGASQLKAYQRTVLNIAAAVLAMVAVGNGMAWMRFQTREGNRLDLWMLRQILGNRKRIAGVALQTQVQGLKPLKEEEAIEWRQRCADVTHPLKANLQHKGDAS